MGRERQGESTRRMSAAKVGEKGLFPRPSSRQPALLLRAHPQPGTVKLQQLCQLPVPRAAPTPWTRILGSPGYETHVSYLKAEAEVRDSTFPPPRGGKSRHSKGLKAQLAVSCGFRNFHLFYLMAKPLPVVRTAVILLYQSGGTVWQERQMTALHTYTKLTQILPFCHLIPCFYFLARMACIFHSYCSATL